MSDEAPQLSAKPRQGSSAVFVFDFHMKGAKWPMGGEGAAGVFGAGTASRVATPPPASKLSGRGVWDNERVEKHRRENAKEVEMGERKEKEGVTSPSIAWESGCGEFCCVYLRKSAIEGRNDSYISQKRLSTKNESET